MSMFIYLHNSSLHGWQDEPEAEITASVDKNSQLQRNPSVGYRKINTNLQITIIDYKQQQVFNIFILNKHILILSFLKKTEFLLNYCEKLFIVNFHDHFWTDAKSMSCSLFVK